MFYFVPLSVSSLISCSIYAQVVINDILNEEEYLASDGLIEEIKYHFYDLLMFFARLCHAIAMNWLTRLLPMLPGVMKPLLGKIFFQIG